MKTLKLISISALILFVIITASVCKKNNEMNEITDSSVTRTVKTVIISNPENDYQPNETSVDINPANPNNLIAAANRKYVYYSFDGGASWTQNELSSSMGVLCDPCVRFGPDGTVYYAHLSYVEGEILADRMVVQKSVDGGVSWNDGVGFEKNGKQHDREWITVDFSDSQYGGNIYCTWSQYDEFFNPGPDYESNILCASSDDNGETWSDAVIVSDKSGDCMDDDMTLQGAKPIVGLNGELYVCWSGYDTIYFDKSLDGGETFGTDVVVTDQPGGWGFGECINGISRSDGCPTILCDRSNSQYKGRLYVLWSDAKNGEDDIDVFIKVSDNGGETWSNRKRVNDDEPGKQQFFPNMTVDPVTGYVYVVFYDRRNTQGIFTDIYLARSVDGGQTFENIRITDSPFNPNGAFIGDYIDITAYNRKIYPVWTECDYDGSKNIVLGIIDESN